VVRAAGADCPGRKHTMRNCLALGMVLLLAVPGLAAGKKVQFKGKLQTGIVAIGGETTGVILDVKKKGKVVRYELDLTKNKALRDKADKLNGKEVEVKGTLNVRKGLAVKERRIITVTSLKAAGR
jgi:hypothetical protein